MEYFEEKRQKIAAKLIKNWKQNEAALLAEYGSRSDYFSKAAAEALWQDEKIKKEFDYDFSTLEAYLRNENNVTSHTSQSKQFTKPAAASDRDATADTARAKWDTNSALRKEFSDDFEAYLAYEKNRNNVKSYNG
jgi:hypothetical protein